MLGFVDVFLFVPVPVVFIGVEFVVVFEVAGGPQ